MNYWKNKALDAIERAIASGKVLGLSGDALKKHIDSHYPFGPRSNHPYKVWLKERQNAFIRLFPEDYRSGVKAEAADDTQQMLLFEE